MILGWEKRLRSSVKSLELAVEANTEANIPSSKGVIYVFTS